MMLCITFMKQNMVLTIIIYPDLDILRKLYSNYILNQIEDNNEIVLINPFYETTESVSTF